jgi:MipA family protein
LKTISSLSAIIFLTFIAGFIPANASNCVNTNNECVIVGQWEFAIALGLGGRSNPLVDGDDIPLLLIPKISYYGESIFFEDLTLGYTFHDRPSLMISAITTLNYDSLYFNRRDGRNIFVDLSSEVALPGDAASGNSEGQISVNDINHRSTTLLAGIEFINYNSWGEFQLQLLTDINQISNGHQIGLNVLFPYNTYQWDISYELGIIWKSEDLVNYYYGISLEESNSLISPYFTEASLNSFLKFNMTRTLSKNWRTDILIKTEWLGKEITNSPLVEDKMVSTLFFGATYHF